MVSQKMVSLKANVGRWRIFSQWRKRKRRRRSTGVLKIGSGHLPQA